jgi:hypothetical protein
MVVADFIEMLSTSTGAAGAVTVTVQDPDLVLSRLEVAVIVAEPGATAVTTPVVLTVATSESLLDHVTVLSAEEGEASTVAVNCCVSFGSSVTKAGATVTLLTVGVTGVEPPTIS